MVRHRVRHAHRLIRHTHIRTKEQHRRITVMRPKRILVHSWHVRSHRTVCRIRVAHVPLGLVRIATITMRQIRLVHPRIVLNRLPVQRVKQITMVRHRVRHAHRLIRHTHIRTKEQHRRTIAMRPRRTLVHSWHVRSQRTVRRTPVAHVPLGLVRIATITMPQIRLVRQRIVLNRLLVQRVRRGMRGQRRAVRVVDVRSIVRQGQRLVRLCQLGTIQPAVTAVVMSVQVNRNVHLVRTAAVVYRTPVQVVMAQVRQDLMQRQTVI